MTLDESLVCPVLNHHLTSTTSTTSPHDERGTLPLRAPAGDADDLAWTRGGGLDQRGPGPEGMRMTLPAWTRGGLDQGDADDLVACLDGPTRLPTRWTSSLTESEEVRNI